MQTMDRRIPWLGGHWLYVAALVLLPASLPADEWKGVRSTVLEPVAAEETEQTTPALPEATATEVTPTEASISEAISEGCDTCCDSCDTCCKPCCICPPGRIWARGETLLWWADGMDTPPLVTQGTIENGGALGPGTTVLYGGEGIDPGLLVGGRFEVGFWLDDCQTCAVELGGFFLGQGSDSFSAGSDGSVVISRPFFDPISGQEVAELVSYPDIVAGSVDVSSSMNAGGANAGLRKNLCCASCPTCDACDSCDSCVRDWFNVPKLRCCRIDAIGGFRYFALDDDLGINENLIALPGNQAGVAAGTNILVSDSFDSQNDFFGGYIGAVADVYRGRWWFEVGGQVSLGANYRQVNINGATTVIDPTGQTAMSSGGLLAQSSNIGKYEDTVFSVIPQVDLRVGYQLTSCLRVYTGYSFLYMTNVARAGDQIDTTVNPELIPPQSSPITGPIRPAFDFQDSGFWLQGVLVGAELRF